MDDGAQVSLEYLFIFSIAMIVIIAFTLPLAEFSLNETQDISKTLNVKSEVSKISNSISQVYSEGQGSRQTLCLSLDQSVSLTVRSSYISTAFPLNDGTSKTLRIYHDSNLDNLNLYLNKGENTVIVEWPMDRQKMLIYRKF